MSGIWIAYYDDWSGFCVFEEEIDALRHAVEHSMNVGFAKWGQSLGSGQYPEKR